MNAELLKGVMVHASFYGAYTILFTLSVYVHWKKRTSGLWIHLSFLSVLFILATITYIALLHDVIRFSESMRTIEDSFQSYFPKDTMARVGDVKQFWDGLQREFYQSRTLIPLTVMVQQYDEANGGPPYEPRKPTFVVRVCYMLSNLVADVYITYRCYFVWGRSKRVIVIPSLLIITTLIFQIGPGNAFSWSDGVAGYSVAYIGGLAVTLGTNFLVTLLTAGRIWWMGRKAGFLLQRRMQSRYDRTVQIVLESGLLYPITLLATILMLFVDMSTSGEVNINSIIALNLCVVNIAPTLIIIRVGLGVSSDDHLQTTTQALNAAEVISSDDDESQMKQTVMAN